MPAWRQWYLVRLLRWVFGYLAVWLLLAAIGSHVVVCWTVPGEDDRPDVWGTVLQLLGIVCVVYGLHQKLREHGKMGLWAGIAQALRAAWEARPRWRPQVVTASGEATLGGFRLEGHGMVSPAPDATVEQRLAILEQQAVAFSREAHALRQAQRGTDARVRELAAELGHHRHTLEAQLRAAMTGTFTLELVGVACLAVGVWYGTIPTRWTPMVCG